MIRMIFCLIFTLFLSACMSEKNVHATCPLLKSQLVFGGQTSNVRNAEIQNAEEPLQQIDYDRHCSQ